jgi:hypothetical protein
MVCLGILIACFGIRIWNFDFEYLILNNFFKSLELKISFRKKVKLLPYICFFYGGQWVVS